MMVLTTICAAASRGARPAVRLSARHVSMMSQTQQSGPNVDAAAAALGESSSSFDGADASASQPKLSERFAFLPDGKELRKVPRQLICNVISTVVGAPFVNWVKARINERNV